MTLYKILFASALVVLCSLYSVNETVAQISCSTDAFGTTRCSNGQTFSTDAFGTTRDNRGNSWSTDAFGTTRGSDGSSYSTDAFGTTRDNREIVGAQTHSA